MKAGQRIADTPLPATLADFHRWLPAQAEPFEFIDGVPRLMAPGSKRHSVLKMNVGTALHDAVAGGPCRTFIDSVSIEVTGSYVIPDVVVDCGPLDLSTPQATAPVVVVEIGSPSTEQDDLARKLRLYMLAPTVHHYLHVLQDERLIIHHRRESEDAFLSRLVRSGTIALDPPGISLGFDQVYAGL